MYFSLKMVSFWLSDSSTFRRIQFAARMISRDELENFKKGNYWRLAKKISRAFKKMFQILLYSSFLKKKVSSSSCFTHTENTPLVTCALNVLHTHTHARALRTHVCRTRARAVYLTFGQICCQLHVNSFVSVIFLELVTEIISTSNPAL